MRDGDGDGVTCIAGKAREVIEPQYNYNIGSDFSVITNQNINIYKIVITY